MDNLTIQDAFAPYHADRDSASLPRDKRLPAESDTSLTRRAASALPTHAGLSDKPHTTEH